MIFVWFVYGLAFFVLGLAVLIYPKKESKFELARHIWKIGAFGILHGINEWLDMFIAIGGPLPPAVMEKARMATLSGSFMFLLLFGSTAVLTRFKHSRLVRAIPALLTLAWLVIFVFVEAEQRLVLGDILARYLLGAPGALLTAAALWSRIPQFKAMKLRPIAASLTVAAVTTLVYGVLAGVVVKRADFFPASVLNYESFIALTGMPVQIFRAVCAVVIACSAIHILDVFRWETQEALRMSELRCATVASAMPVFLFMTDRNTVVTFAQGKGLDVAGVSREQVSGRRVCEVFSCDGHFAEGCRRVLTGRDFVTTAILNGLTFEVHCSALQDARGEPMGIVGVALDISTKVQTQKELEEYRLGMERQARQAAVGAFSASMAQQLAEPLSVARLVLDKTVGDLDASEAPATVRNSVVKSLAAVSRAHGILERFADVAHPDIPVGMQPVGLYQIAKRMMGVFAESAERRGLAIAIKDFNVVPSLSISSRALELVFYNLIQAAIDAAEPGRKQSLTLRCEAGPDHIDLHFVCTCQVWRGDLAVADSTSVDRRGESAGLPNLGLAIVKRIVEDHGGKISLDTGSNRLSTITVGLPAKVSFMVETV